MVWKAIAWVVSRPRVFNWLRRRAMRTPYTHIVSRDGSTEYMRRFWLFNPYGKREDGGTAPARWAWLPSIRLHHILRADDDPHLHDHPWNARTIILQGVYLEQLDDLQHVMRFRTKGYTGRLLFGQYHRIHWLEEGGVWTLFFTWKYRGTWGFRVNGEKVPYYQYLAERNQNAME